MQGWLGIYIRSQACGKHPDPVFWLQRLVLAHATLGLTHLLQVQLVFHCILFFLRRGHAGTL